MVKWEYLTLFISADSKQQATYLKERFPKEKEFSAFSPRALMPRLNELGAEGWELLSLAPVAAGEKGDIQVHPSTTLGSTKIWTNEYLCIFKRPVPS